MPLVPIIMPQLGESIAEATVVRVVPSPGDAVNADSGVMEVETNKAVMEVTAPCSGTLAEVVAELNESYPVGAVLGYIEATEAEAKRIGLSPASEEKESLAPRKKEKLSRGVPQRVEPTVRGLPVPAHAGGATYLSPRMKARMSELGLHAADLAGIAGSGGSGRVTIDDLERFLQDLERNRITPASPMRVAVADAMRRSWTRPLATIARPIAMDALLAHRRRQTLKAGPTLYTIRALALALTENSAPAGRLVGDRIVHPRSIDIGFAVEAADGVLVPVIRNADQSPLGNLVEKYNRLVELARQRRLPVTDTGGSIATVTNYGVFGCTLATPIPLPEQTLLIGMGAGRVVPAWNAETESFEPVTEAQFTLSFDHRVLDGGAAGRLLQRVAELINQPDEL